MKNKRVILKAVFMYILVTSLLWIFLVSYSNSYNRINAKKISPASITINNNELTINILHDEFKANFDFILPDSKFYYILYFISSDSMRFAENLLIKGISFVF